MRYIKYIIRYYFAIVVYLLKCTPFHLIKNRSIISVINYHYFVDDDISPINPALEININNFKNQMLILNNQFKFINNISNFDYYFTSTKKNGDINKLVMITIDDADSNLEKIIPFIQKYNIHIFLFAPIGFCLGKNNLVGIKSMCLHHLYFKIILDKSKLNIKKKLLDKYNLVMNSDISYLNKLHAELIKDNNSIFCIKKYISLNKLSKYAKNTNITIASHSMSHVPLSNLPDIWLKWEIHESINYIKKIGGNTSMFAYPYGDKKSFNENVKKILLLSNINYAFTTRSIIVEKSSNKLELGRTFMFNTNNKQYVLGIATGTMKLFDSILNR